MNVRRPLKASCSQEDLDLWASAIIEAGYSAGKDSTYVIAFSSKENLIYLDKMTTKPGIVLHPNLGGVLEPLVQQGKQTLSVFHNSGMGAFPKRLNNGAKPEHYGLKVQFSTCPELGAFLKALS